MTPQVVSFNCVLKTKTGKVLSSSYNHDVLNSQEEDGVILGGLVKALQNLKKGEKRHVDLKAEEAYGLYDPKKVILLPRKRFSRDTCLNLGAMVVVVSKTGKSRTYRVLQVHGDMVSLDGNHPLAGQDLIFEIEALSARQATEDEIFEASNKISSQVLH